MRQQPKTTKPPVVVATLHLKLSMSDRVIDWLAPCGRQKPCSFDFNLEIGGWKIVKEWDEVDEEIVSCLTSLG